MNIFPPDANLPTQLWIALRFFECGVVLSAATLLGRRQLPIGPLALGFLATGIVLAWLVLSGRFPDCYIEGIGLTEFKINSEYAIAAGFVLTLLLLQRKREMLAPDIHVLVVLAVIVDIVAEFAFTKYVSVYGNANLIGHLLLLTSTYFLYRALVLQGIQKPQFLLFQHLNREKELLARSEAELAIKVAERTAEVTESNRRLQDELAERRRVEQQLLESEEMLRLTRNVALDATIVVDAAGRVVVWNPAATRLFGYPADEVIGRSMHELIVPERFRAAALAGILRFGSTGEGALIGRISELVAMRSDGSEVPVELSISTVQIRGVWHAIGIIRDITDRKAAVQAREQLAAIVESTGEAVIGKCLDGTVSTWNSGATRLYGYAAAEMRGQNVEALVVGRREVTGFAPAAAASGRRPRCDRGGTERRISEKAENENRKARHSASGCCSGVARRNASSPAQRSVMPRIIGIAFRSQPNRRALNTCGTRQQSASVGVAPWQNIPVRGSPASIASTAPSPTSIQCRYHAFFCSSLTPNSRVRYCSTRRLLIGWMSHAMACAMARMRARSAAVPGSSAGSG